MTGSEAFSLSLKVFHGVGEAGEAAWDELGGGKPFQSAAWYRYGEQVMDDCTPVYLIVYQGDRSIARGTLWVIGNEPLPVSMPVYKRLKPIFRRWPLLICRSPLSNSAGLILPEGPLREPALQLISREAQRQARLQHCSFLIFDFLSQAECGMAGWPEGSGRFTGGEAGTCMQVEWESFESYMDSREARNRRRIAYNKRKAAEQGIRVVKCSPGAALEEPLRLIRRVEEKYGSPHNPWTRKMLEQMEKVESTFLEAWQGNELVGCVLLLYDNRAQLPTALGHAGAATYDYLEMLYANIEDAIGKNCTLLRWGSGSYDIKRHLGFEPEDNNHVIVWGTGWLTRLMTRAGSLFFREEAH